jgi:hypothetical protein
VVIKNKISDSANFITKDKKMEIKSLFTIRQQIKESELLLGIDNYSDVEKEIYLYIAISQGVRLSEMYKYLNLQKHTISKIKGAVMDLYIREIINFKPPVNDDIYIELAEW